ncbi:unnamed protein product, partial [Ilex paraguariensis]
KSAVTEATPAKLQPIYTKLSPLQGATHLHPSCNPSTPTTTTTEIATNEHPSPISSPPKPTTT